MTNLNGLTSIESITVIQFFDNDQLSSLNGLETLTKLDGGLIISSNVLLADISAVSNVKNSTDESKVLSLRDCPLITNLKC